MQKNILTILFVLCLCTEIRTGANVQYSTADGHPRSHANLLPTTTFVNRIITRKTVLSLIYFMKYCSIFQLPLCSTRNRRPAKFLNRHRDNRKDHCSHRKTSTRLVPSHEKFLRHFNIDDVTCLSSVSGQGHVSGHGRGSNQVAAGSESRKQRRCHQQPPQHAGHVMFTCDVTAFILPPPCPAHFCTCTCK